MIGRTASSAHETGCFIVQVSYGMSSIWEGAPTRKLTPNLCVCSQGSCWPHTAIRPQWCLQIHHVRYSHRRVCAYPEHLAEIYPLTRHAQRLHTRPTRKRNGTNYASWFVVGFIFRTYLNFIHPNFYAFIYCLIFVLLSLSGVQPG